MEFGFMKNASNQRTASTMNPYLVQQIQTASPEKLIHILYDAGIKACRKRDRVKVGQVLTELISALNFDYHETALTFFNLYRFALDEANKGHFQNSKMVLEGLDDIWLNYVMSHADESSI